MFIAANANHHLSVQRSGRAGCDLSFKSASAHPNGEGVFCCTKTVHLAPNEAKTKANLPPTQGGGPFHVRVVGLSLD